MPTIRLENVSKSYRKQEFGGDAVNDVSLTLQQGEFIFLVGSRGAGKSTLMEILSGQTVPKKGKIFLDETPVRTLSLMQRWRLRSLVGLVPSDPKLNRKKTVRENLLAGSGLHRDRKAIDAQLRKALGMVGLPGIENRRPREFSASDCRLMGMARALLKSPALLILDEVMDQLNDDTSWDLLHLLMELNAHGTTILMVTNDGRYINMLRKRVVTMADGKIVKDVQKGRYELFGRR